MYGKLANEYGNSKERRISSDQQDHSEATTARYYEQSCSTSIKAVAQNEKFHQESNLKEKLTQAAREDEDGLDVRQKMKTIFDFPE